MKYVLLFCGYDPLLELGDQEQARAAELTANRAEHSLLRRRIGLRVLP